MRRLSIMIDESGNFDMGKYSSPFYCLTMIFHDQSEIIAGLINHFDEILIQNGFSTTRAVHTNPLIRREEPHQDISIEERKRLFSIFTAFASHLPIKYKTFIFDKGRTDTSRLFW